MYGGSASEAELQLARINVYYNEAHGLDFDKFACTPVSN